MLIQDWEYFLELARCGNLNQAANNLYITYQGLRKSLIKLEEELGDKLFIRMPNSAVKLTEFGEYVYKHLADPLTRYWKESLIASETFQTFRSKSLKIGIPSPYSRMFAQLNIICSEFSSQHPDCNIELISNAWQTNFNSLENDELDICFCECDADNSYLCRSKSIYREYALFVNKEHHLAQKDFVTIYDLRREYFIGFYQNYLSTKYLEQTAHVDRSHISMYDASNPLVKILLDNNLQVRFAPFDSTDSNSELYQNCVALHFDPPIYIELAFLYKDRLAQKQLLTLFLEHYHSNLEKLKSADITRYR